MKTHECGVYMDLIFLQSPSNFGGEGHENC